MLALVRHMTAALRSALEEVERLSRLARAMLVATAGTVRDPEAPLPVVALRPVLDTVVARHGLDHATVVVDCPADIEICCDPDDLDRIVTNLLDNALEHGTPPVHIRVHRPAPVTVQVRVRDHGPGIDPDFLPRAFERFTRADTARTHGGSGLGLAIVATLALRNHATVTAANHPGGGLEITLTLPTPPSAAKTGA